MRRHYRNITDINSAITINVCIVSILLVNRLDTLNMCRYLSNITYVYLAIAIRITFKPANSKYLYLVFRSKHSKNMTIIMFYQRNRLILTTPILVV